MTDRKKNKELSTIQLERIEFATRFGVEWEVYKNNGCDTIRVIHDEQSLLERLKSMFVYKDGQLFKNGKSVGYVNSGGYLRVKVDNRSYLVHRLIYLLHHGELPEFIDHIDGKPLNNRIENLRKATTQQNAFNVKPRKGSSSKYKGVSFFKRYKKWVVRIRINGKRKYLGNFDCEEEAGRAYDEAAKIYHGEFARLNFDE